eukprot:jgi/Tetstr1/420844/TSEL_011919.t1
MDIDDKAGNGGGGIAQSPGGSPIIMMDRADGDEERAERGRTIVDDDDAIWEGADEEREPTKFLSILNGSDGDDTRGEEDEHEERRNGNHASKALWKAMPKSACYIECLLAQFMEDELWDPEAPEQMVRRQLRALKCDSARRSALLAGGIDYEQQRIFPYS